MRISRALIAVLMGGFVCLGQARGEAMLQLFNQSWNEISQKLPEIAEAGYTSLWLPPASKANSQFSAGYDRFDPFDLGNIDQKGTIATRYGTKDELVRMVRIAHRFGIRVYFDDIMNHRSYDVPGYDAYTPITVYPGLLPEDFHLRVTSDGFYRKWDNISNWGDVWQIQNRNFSDLIDLAHESPNNNNFGYTEGSANPKLAFIRQPGNPEYYMDQDLPAIAGSWRPFNGANGDPLVEDTASYIIRAALWFMSETKCDGLRLDAVKHVPSYFFGDYLNATANGYTGAIQTMFDYVHGYGNNVTGNGYVEGDDNRNSCFDAEAVRNDALIFGEHLGEPPSFDEYTGRGMRLVDAPLYTTFNSTLGYGSLQGWDQRNYDGYGYLNAYNRVMFVQSHDNGYANRRELSLAYIFMREGVPVIYSDGWRQSATCTQCGGEFPRNAYASYLGEFGDNKMPELVTLHNQLARGGSRPRWSDADIVAYERYEYREPNLGDAYNNAFATTVLFVMNDNYGFPGDISFDDSVAQNDTGMPATCYPVENTRGVGLAVGFPPGSVLVQLASSAPGSDRACSRVLVRNATGNLAAAQASINATSPVDRLVYTGGQYIPSGGGGIEFKVPSGGYVMYAYEGPQASRPNSAVMGRKAISIQQNAQDVPSMTVRRSTGPDGDQSYNPVYPFKMRGSVDSSGNVIGGSNVSNLTYAIDIPIITNANPFNIVVRMDGSTDNMLVKLDGGTDLNSQMGFAPTAGFDRRDNRPGFAYDMFLGYEAALFGGRFGPEKFAATNVTRNTPVSLGAETYHYTVGGTGTIVFGAGGGLELKAETADWVYHDPPAAVTVAGGSATQRVPMIPTAGQAVTNYVKIGYQFQITNVALYYTTDGSNPEGSYGVAKPGTTTQVAQGTFVGDDTLDNTIDWWRVVIPGSAHTGGATIKYKIAAYKSTAGVISDADTSKYYGQTQFSITNFNPTTARVWLHANLKTNDTVTGLEEGFHIVRARGFIPRTDKSSVFSTFLQTFYYDAQPPQGVIAFPANNGDTLGSQQYGVVVRADTTTSDVEYNITDGDPNNDDVVTGQTNGNGLSNGVPVFARANQVFPLPSLSTSYPDLPLEYRFDYIAVPSNGVAHVTVRLKEASTTTFTNRFATLTRSNLVCAAPPQTLQIAFPATNGETIALDQNDTYQIVICYSESLGTDIDDFTITIDGAVQARRKADGTALYLLEGSYCGAGKRDLRFDWSGMSAGQHVIAVTYNAQGLSLQATRTVNVVLTGISVNIVNPPDADAAGRSPYTIVLPDKTNAVPAERSFTVVTETSTSVTNVLVSFTPATNAFAGGTATEDLTFVGSTKRWNFVWTNLVQGLFNIRADATGGGSNTAFRVTEVEFNQTVPADVNDDDDDDDGINDIGETTNTPLPSTQPENWSNGEVHVWYFTGKSDPINPDTDNDELPDGLELGLEGTIATNTNTSADTNGDGFKNFIGDTDPPRYNTTDNSSLPNYDLNSSRTDIIRGSATNPNNADTDGDGIWDGIEDANRNGRVDIGLTNAAGTVTNTIQFPPTIRATSTVERDQVALSYPNAKWLETDPNNTDTDNDGLLDGVEDANNNGRIDGDSNTNRVWNAGELWTETDPLAADTDHDELPDGWEIQHGLNPWDDGVIGHTNMNSGVVITGATNGPNGDPDADSCNNQCEFLNNTDPWVPNDAPPPPANAITIGPGPVIGTTGGVTWYEEFQDWTADDLKALDEHDGAGFLKEGRDLYPWWDGYDWSRDILAFYARDGGADNKYYFRVDFHDLQYKAEQSSVDIYVVINFGTPGDFNTANLQLPDDVDTKSDMGWKIVIAAYDTNNGRVYVKRQGIDAALGAYQARGYTPDPSGGGFVGSYYRSDLDACEFAISRQALIDAGWNGIAPLLFQVFTTRDNTCNTGSANCPGDTPKSGSDITDTIYDDTIAESDSPTPPNDTLYYFFTSVNQNPINVATAVGNPSVLSQTNRPNVAKLALLLHGNQAILPASIIQTLIYSTNQLTTAGTDASFDPGLQATGYHRALDSAQVFGIRLNLHLSGSLISALQWAQSNAALDPTGQQSGPLFNQRVAGMIYSQQVAVTSGLFADHIAPYFTGSVNRAAIQLQDEILRTTYGSSSVSANSPVYLAERVADGPTLTDLAANSGHNYIILDQIVHLWWWAEQLYGFGNGRLTALSDAGYQINRFNGMNAFLISAASDQMYVNDDLGASVTLRELLLRKAQSGVRDQVVILGDNWETAASAGGGNRNADALNLNLRWIANHPWIMPVALDKFAAGQVDINNDGALDGNDAPFIQDRGSAAFANLSKDYIRHSSRTNYNHWYYGLTGAEESFFAKNPPIRSGVFTTKTLGHVLTNGTILADTWTSVQGATGSLSNLAKLVYLNGIFETAFHDEDNGNYERFSTGDYKYPDTTGLDTLSSFAAKPNSRQTRQAAIVAAAATWAASNPLPATVASQTDVDQDGEVEHVLSNNRVYAVFERMGGRLIAALARDTATSNAYQVVGNLVSTPDFETEDEGDVNLLGGLAYAYRTSGFKDWFAVTNSVSGTGTTRYVNDLYTAVQVAGPAGWRFTSSDGKIIKTIRLAAGETKLEATYAFSGGVTKLYVRNGLAPDLYNLVLRGQQNLQGPATAGGKVTLINSNTSAIATVSVNYSDTGHTNAQYNASASDGGLGVVAVPLRNQAQTHQIEIESLAAGFSFAIEMTGAPNTAPQDWDGDGLPDTWEDLYGLDEFDDGSIDPNNGATGDPDGDGMNNFAEFTAGTSPVDAASWFRILNITRTGTTNTVTWSSVSNKLYQVHAATNLVGAVFIQFDGTINAAGTLSSYTDTNAAGNQKFYKVLVLPAP
jgi:glycosidase